MKYIKTLLKNIVLSTITIYYLNLVLNKIDIVVPINIYSIGMTSTLGISGLISYLVLLFKFYR